MNELDEVDKKILKLLQENSNYTIKQLSDKIFLSATPIYERLKRLEKNGVIKKYVALLDREKLDKNLLVFCNISLKEHAKLMGEKFVKEVLLLSEVVEFYNISGEYDFLLKVMVKDMQEYQNFIMNKLASLDNIGHTQSIFVMSEINNSTAIPI